MLRTLNRFVGLLFVAACVLHAQEPTPAAGQDSAAGAQSADPSSAAASQPGSGTPSNSPGNAPGAQTDVTHDTTPPPDPDAPSPPVNRIPTKAALTNDEVVVESFSPAPEANGPGVLTRGFTTSALDNQQIRFRPYVSLTGATDSGIETISNKGLLSTTQGYGLDVAFGITGRKILKKDLIELEFHGDFSNYRPNSYYNGSNYQLNLIWQHQFTPHIKVAFTENSAQYSSNYTLLNAPSDLSTTNTNMVVQPNTQLFNNSALYVSSGADVIYQKTARLSFDFGGTGFAVHRDSLALYGTTGSEARADATYRLTKRLTIGSYYNFTQYNFTHAFGNTNVNTVGTVLSYTLARRTELRLRIGGSQVQTQGVGQVAVDPTLAAVLGYQFGPVAVFAKNYVPDLSGELTRVFHNATGAISAVESVSPGNGLILTSRRRSGYAHYDYTGIRRYTLSAGAGYDSLSTLGFNAFGSEIGQYSGASVRVGLTRVIRDGFQAVFYTEYRHYDTPGLDLLRNTFHVSLGLSWSPGERPLKLW